MSEVKGEIVSIRKIFDEVTCRYCWEVVVEMDDVPALRCDSVELGQKR